MNITKEVPGFDECAGCLIFEKFLTSRLISEAGGDDSQIFSCTIIGRFAEMKEVRRGQLEDGTSVTKVDSLDVTGVCPAKKADRF